MAYDDGESNIWLEVGWHVSKKLLYLVGSRMAYDDGESEVIILGWE